MASRSLPSNLDVSAHAAIDTAPTTGGSSTTSVLLPAARVPHATGVSVTDTVGIVSVVETTPATEVVAAEVAAGAASPASHSEAVDLGALLRAQVSVRARSRVNQRIAFLRPRLLQEEPVAARPRPSHDHSSAPEPKGAKVRQSSRLKATLTGPVEEQRLVNGQPVLVGDRVMFRITSSAKAAQYPGVIMELTGSDGLMTVRYDDATHHQNGIVYQVPPCNVFRARVGDLVEVPKKSGSRSWQLGTISRVSAMTFAIELSDGRRVEVPHHDVRVPQ